MCLSDDSTSEWFFVERNVRYVSKEGDVADNKTGKPGSFPALAESNAAGEQKGILPAALRTSVGEALTGQGRRERPRAGREERSDASVTVKHVM